jgi:hypothetical protein
MKTNYNQFNREYQAALFNDWCSGDFDMFKYLSGTDFSMNSLKKAK